MKKTKLFALAGLTTLAIVSIFGTKPARKFIGVSAIVAPNGNQLFSDGTSPLLTVTSGSPNSTTLQLVTAGSKVFTMLTSTSGGSKVYIKG
jgi:hypothetical protein